MRLNGLALLVNAARARVPNHSASMPQHAVPACPSNLTQDESALKRAVGSHGWAQNTALYEVALEQAPRNVTAAFNRRLRATQSPRNSDAFADLKPRCAG